VQNLPPSGEHRKIALRIRPATLGDIPAMMALASHAVTAAEWTREQYERVLAEHSLRRALILEEKILELEPNRREEENQPRGFLVAQEIAGEWEIENIAVAGPARRRGLGTRLLGEFLAQARARGARAVYLEVRESNRAARALYEKWAFEESGRRKSYYRQPDEDAIVYRLSLA
jgi:[ribosomal protein S18]-alanine N-acetyltransferase